MEIAVKKFLNLILNELTKQTKKVSFLVCFIIVVVIAIIFPIFTKYAPSIFGNNRDRYKSQFDYEYESAITFYNETKDLQDEESKLASDYAKVMSEAYKFVIDNTSNDYSDWRYSYAMQYIDNTSTKFITDKVLEGKDGNKIINTIQQKYIYSRAEFKSFDGYTEDQVRQLNNMADENIKNARNIIVENNYSLYCAEIIKQCNTQKEYLSQQIADIDSKLAAEQNNEELLYEKRGIELQINIQDETIRIYQYIIDNSIKYDPELWERKTINAIENKLGSAYVQPLTKSMFEDQLYMVMQYKNYDKYLENQNKQIQDKKDELKRLWYSLDNKIPSYEYTNSTREGIIGVFSLIGLITLMMCIFAGGSVSNEHSTGTIRMLLIRPAKRWKIILSKYLSNIILILIFAFSVLISISFVTVIINGIKDITYPVLEIVDNNVVEVNFGLWIISKYIIALLPVLCIMTLAFMLSTLTKVTAIAVGVSIFGNLTGSTINAF